jgi:hypothetical protein
MIWRRIIAAGEVIGGLLALSAMIFAAQAAVSKSVIASGIALDSLTLAAGITLWFRGATGIVLSEITLALQSVQVFTHGFVWQYVAGPAFLVQIIGGKLQWSAGLLIRHTLLPQGESTGAGLNLMAIFALALLIKQHRRIRLAKSPGVA